MDPKEHWEHIYQSRSPTAVSWYQSEARVSLDLIRRVAPDLETPVMDVGGGASTLVDGLLEAGFRDVTVLDLAGSALTLARARLGSRAGHVHWLEADVLEAKVPAAKFGVWHDRAVFHFLTRREDRTRYVAQVRHAVASGGHVIVASFSVDGPTRCSGLDVVRYSAESMHAEFGRGFQLLESVPEEHHTPNGSVQAFVYCLCRVTGEP